MPGAQKYSAHIVLLSSPSSYVLMRIPAQLMQFTNFIILSMINLQIRHLVDRIGTFVQTSLLKKSNK